MAIAAQPHYIQEEASAGRESSLAAVFFSSLAGSKTRSAERFEGVP